VLHAGPHTALVDSGNALEVVERLLGGIGGRDLDAGIVERHVETPEPAYRQIDRSRRLRLIGDIAGDVDRNATLADDAAGFLLGKVAVPVGQHDGRSILGECPRRCATWPLIS
jgi:hypothetical protein